MPDTRVQPRAVRGTNVSLPVLFGPAEPNLLLRFGRAKLFHNNCIDWMQSHNGRSIHAVVTDPPYGLVEYSVAEQAKLRRNAGGVSGIL